MFGKLKEQVQRQFGTMATDELFVVQMEKNELFDAYLAAFPPEERQGHNCNSCKSFLNHYGNIVTIVGDAVRTIWDFDCTTAPFQDVPKALRDLVISRPIAGVFLSTFDKLGTDHNHQQLESGEVVRWDHFMVTLPKNKVIRSSDSLDTIQGQLRTTKEVFQRSLETITIGAVETVLDLIVQNTLYRGKEFETMVCNFQKHQKLYALAEDDNAKSRYVWLNAKDGGRIRNTAIGTLLVNLSEDMPLEQAVRAFEAMVAPANYKRPTALVTEKMVKQAQDQIAELGFLGSLKRRHATRDDIPVANLLFVNRENSTLSVFDELRAESSVNPKSFSRAKEILLTEFVADVLPKATSIDLLLQNNSNFMSLIAPDDADAPSMFAWDNAISWTYQNNLTDAIREKVKSAGGDVTGELRISLEWFNFDDLDLHVTEPNGNKIYYVNKRSLATGGFLDVDMNAGHGTTREPVENITFPNKSKMMEGLYTIKVHNFSKRENDNIGFNIQVECQGNTIDLSHAAAVPDHKEIVVATFTYRRDTGISAFKSGLKESVSQRELNGLFTNRFQPVTMLLYSPNHWSGHSIGNQHLFFILKNAHVDVPLRPFFNEFLKPTLVEHRKVLEVLGGKLMVKPADTQLSGVGYSLTQRNSAVVRVNGNVLRVAI